MTEPSSSSSGRAPASQTPAHKPGAGQGRSALGAVLTGIFVIALLMGPGPGMLLINRPRAILGLPALYAWGLLWYAVEVAVVVVAYFFVWSRNE